MAELAQETVVGETIIITGDVQGDENLTVYGRIDGTIALSKHLTVAESGIVKAEVQVQAAIVSGIVVGNITATDYIEITVTGRLVGDIKAPRIIIARGARVNGMVDMGDLEAPRPTVTKTARPQLTPNAPSPAAAVFKPMSLPTPRPPPIPVSRMPTPVNTAPIMPIHTEIEDEIDIDDSLPIGSAMPAMSPETVARLSAKRLKKKVVVRKRP